MTDSVRYRLQIFESKDPTAIEEYERIRSLLMNQEGLELVKEETTFTKEGTYIVALHWVEHKAQSVDRKIIKDMVESGG
jgi:hypothetical protein